MAEIKMISKGNKLCEVGSFEMSKNILPRAAIIIPNTKKNPIRREWFLIMKEIMSMDKKDSDPKRK